MSLIDANIGQIRTLGLPKGRHTAQLKMQNGRVQGDDLVSVAAVEKFLGQAEELYESHRESDGPATWYDSWSQQHDRNGWSRDADESEQRSLRTRELSDGNTLVAETVGRKPLVEGFPGISPLLPESFKAQDSQGFISMEYDWDGGELQSIREVRSFPNQPREELNLSIGADGLITVETSVEEFRIPE